jgi:hypothetical protein
MEIGRVTPVPTSAEDARPHGCTAAGVSFGQRLSVASPTRGQKKSPLPTPCEGQGRWFVLAIGVLHPPANKSRSWASEPAICSCPWVLLNHREKLDFKTLLGQGQIEECRLSYPLIFRRRSFATVGAIFDRGMLALRVLRRGNFVLRSSLMRARHAKVPFRPANSPVEWPKSAKIRRF